MICLRSSLRFCLMCGIAAAVLCSFSSAVATAQSVRGHGEISNGPDLSPTQISVDASIDADGVVQGTMAWIGDVFGTPPFGPIGSGTGGPAEPFIVAVTDIVFNGNTAIVAGIVVASPDGVGNGVFVEFSFTDNSGTGLPDEVDGVPIEAGNITVTD